MNNLPDDFTDDATGELGPLVRELKSLTPSSSSHLQSQLFYELGKRSALSSSVRGCGQLKRLGLERIAWGGAVCAAFFSGIWMNGLSVTTPDTMPHPAQVDVAMTSPQPTQNFDSPTLAAPTVTEEPEAEQLIELPNWFPLAGWSPLKDSVSLAYDPRKPWGPLPIQSAAPTSPLRTGPTSRAALLSEIASDIGNSLPADAPSLLPGWFINR